MAVTSSNPAARSRVDSAMFWSAVRASIVVGTALTLLNQGDTLFAGPPWPSALAWKIPLTYVVPFGVTIYGALSARRSG